MARLTPGNGMLSPQGSDGTATAESVKRPGMNCVRTSRTLFSKGLRRALSKLLRS